MSKRVLIGQVMTPGGAIPTGRGREIREMMDQGRRQAEIDRAVGDVVRALRKRYRNRVSGWFWITVGAGLLAYVTPYLWPLAVPPGLEWVWNAGLWFASLDDDFDKRVRERLRRENGL